MQASKSLKPINPSNGGWQREGQIVKALYLGTEECVGIIEHSRVAYGGKVKHSLKLYSKVSLPWRRIDTDFKFYDIGEYIGIDEENIVEILE